MKRRLREIASGAGPRLRGLSLSLVLLACALVVLGGAAALEGRGPLAGLTMLAVPDDSSDSPDGEQGSDEEEEASSEEPDAEGADPPAWRQFACGFAEPGAGRS